MNNNIIEVSSHGRWYPNSKQELASLFLEYFKAERPVATQDNWLALIAPHAGYIYSGKVAAKAFAQVQGRPYRRVVIMGPSHQAELFNQIIVPDAGMYRTPFGDSDIDLGFIKKLYDLDLVAVSSKFFTREHSIDNEIPFIQYVLPNIPIVPLLIGGHSYEAIKQKSKIIKSYVNDGETLLVISSDFTHYGESFGYIPFRDDVKKSIVEFNEASLSTIRATDGKRFYDYVQQSGDTICGATPITFLLQMLPPKANFHRLGYLNSGEITGDYSHVVSYYALGFSGAWSNQ